MKSQALVFVIFLFLFACSNNSNIQATINAQETQIASLESSAQEGEIAATTSISIINETPTTVANASTPAQQVVELTPCEAEKWEIIPTGIYYVEPSDLASDAYDYATGNLEGFKLIVVPIAIVNNSQYWGNLKALNRNALVETEDGFRYELVGFSASLEFPYVINNIPNIQSGSAIGAGIGTKIGLDNLIIPPGFAVHGFLVDDEYGSPNDWFQLVLKVAESQNHYQIIIENATVDCYRDGTYIRDIAPTIVIDVDSDIKDVQYPTNSPEENLENFENPILLEDLGTLELLNIEHTEEFRGRTMNILFQFTNASAGYETDLKMQGYFIGDDGIIRQEGTTINVGPAQTKEFELSEIVGELASNFKYVWFNPEGEIFKVISIPNN